MERDSIIYVAGHRGLVGLALTRKLHSQGFRRILVRTRAELDLTDANSVDSFFAANRPEFVFLAAAKVGGIWANHTCPAEFIRENLLVQAHTIHSAWRHQTRRMVLLGSSCIYPKFCPQPMKEEYLLTGELEPTNEPYALAKIAGIKMGQAYRRQYGFDCLSVMPTNLYGPGDNFNLETSHVLPALLRKFHEAKTAGDPWVTVWGTGLPRREFLYVDDLADACVFLMQRQDTAELTNIGTGEDITIGDLASLIGEITGFTGEIRYDSSKPDGTPRKLLDISRLSAMGWRSHVNLRTGIEQTYSSFLGKAPEDGGFRPSHSQESAGAETRRTVP